MALPSRRGEEDSHQVTLTLAGFSSRRQKQKDTYLTPLGLYDKVVGMANFNNPSRDGLEYVGQLRHRTRVARDGSWFALGVLGVVVLLAMFFYSTPGLASRSPGCRALTNGVVCSNTSSTRGLFGSGLGGPIFNDVSPWATTYWVFAITLGIVAIVAFYWLRARASGVAGRVWPFATIFLAILILALVSRSWIIDKIPADFWLRGMQALLVIALGLVALAVFERTWPFALYVAGFFGLALLSCLYDDSNLFTRLGVGSRWGGSSQALPNLILPGTYLLVGGVLFYVARRSHYQFYVARRKISDGE